MKFLTSISPNHRNGDVQATAIQSWIDHGAAVISVNGEGEDVAAYPCVYHVTGATSKGLMKAPYVFVSAFIDYAKEHDLEHVVIINSDIVLKDPDGKMKEYLAASENGLVFANRHDHNGDFANPTRYEHGFDVFIIHRKFFDLIPCSMFCMGQTWWDYWIPYRFIRAGVPIQLVKEPIFLHQRHQVQYDQKEWERMTEHFIWMERYQSPRRGPQQVTNEVYQMIKRHAK